ncbi:MAG: type II toxin-antitoxin system VapC family toxin [Acidobacteriota bacterium]
MHAVDTNILVRLLAEDDVKQTILATALFATEKIWIAKTVLLETEWVLRRGYGFTPKAIAQGFEELLGLPRVDLEDPGVVMAALALFQQGFDFADALHLASRPPGAKFVTFDEALVRSARRAGAVGVIKPPL